MDGPSRRPDYVRKEDIPLLLIMQKKLKYEQRLAESNPHEFEKSEDVTMTDSRDEAVKSSQEEPTSDVQSREVDVAGSQTQGNKRAREHQEATATDAVVIRAREKFNLRK